jgi:hypothetical protein
MDGITMRQGRARRLIDALEHRTGGQIGGEVEWYTVRELAKLMGLKPSVYARLLIVDLVKKNVLNVREGRAANRTMRYEYSITPRFMWEWS